jgi:hypothetical protein
MDYLALTLPGGQTVNPPSGIPTTSTVPAGSVIAWALGILAAAGILAAIFFLVFGSIKWITSQGDKQKVQSARNTIVFAIIGLIIVLFALVIVGTIGNFLGFTLLQ